MCSHRLRRGSELRTDWKWQCEYAEVMEGELKVSLRTSHIRATTNSHASCWWVILTLRVRSVSASKGWKCQREHIDDFKEVRDSAVSSWKCNTLIDERNKSSSNIKRRVNKWDWGWENITGAWRIESCRPQRIYQKTWHWLTGVWQICSKFRLLAIHESGTFKFYASTNTNSFCLLLLSSI